MECLVTRLKGVVENDSLVKLNKLTLLADYAQGEYGVFAIATKSAESPLNLSVTRGESRIKRGGAGFNDATDLGQSTELFDTNISLIYCTPGENAIIDIANVYDIKRLSNVKLDSDSTTNHMLINNREVIKEMLSLEDIELSKVNDTIANVVDLFKNLPNFSALRFKVGEKGIRGNLSDFTPLAKTLKTLSIAQCDNIKGNIEELGSMINLTDLMFYGNQNITGTIEGFVQAQRTARVAAGLPAANAVGINLIWFHSTDVKFDGQFMSVGNSPTLTWTANTITIKNADTYNKTINA